LCVKFLSEGREAEKKMSQWLSGAEGADFWFDGAEPDV
jgi:hypothetical protein